MTLDLFGIIQKHGNHNTSFLHGKAACQCIIDKLLYCLHTKKMIQDKYSITS